jgi:predicted NAD/FAD-dependent oxidoreductase
VLVLNGDGQGPALNVAMISEAQPTYAPPGQALIAAACPGMAHDGTLGEAVTAQMRQWFGDQVNQWRLLRTDHIHFAQPVQNPPFSARRRQKLADGLWVAGDHRDTSSIQGALFSGRRVAEGVHNELLG